MRVIALPVPEHRSKRVPQKVARRLLRGRFDSVLRSAAAVLHEWRRRSRSRAQLARFDDRMLRDIGVTRADAYREINKPFWRK